MISRCDIRSSSWLGRYFSTLKSQKNTTKIWKDNWKYLVTNHKISLAIQKKKKKKKKTCVNNKMSRNNWGWLSISSRPTDIRHSKSRGYH